MKDRDSVSRGTQSDRNAENFTVKKAESVWEDIPQTGLADMVKNRILAKVLEVGIRTVMSNHLYKFKNNYEFFD